MKSEMVRMLVLAMMLTATGTAAGSPSPLYDDELNRCVSALRPAVSEKGATTVVHTITAVRVRGLWREFTIESALRGEDGSALGRISSRCQAQRWGATTRLALRG